MVRQSKDGQELREIFAELNPLNKGYALAVLRSLFFAQQHTAMPPASSENKKPTKQGESNHEPTP